MNNILFLMIWLLEHTELTEDSTEITVKDIKEDVLKEDLPEYENIHLSIGYCLSLIYGHDLKKSAECPVKYYNLKYSANKIRTVLIGGLHE